MDTFKTGKIVLKEICLDSTPKSDGSMRSVVLTLDGWAGDTPIIKSSSEILSVTSQSHNQVAHRSTFQIEAAPNAKGEARIYNKSSHDPSVLIVTVGKVTNHGGFQYDLIADLLGRSEDPLKLLAYTRILARDNNVVGDWATWDKLLKEQPLKQITDPKHPANWNCGAALNKFGHDYFGATPWNNRDTHQISPSNKT